MKPSEQNKVATVSLDDWLKGHDLSVHDSIGSNCFHVMGGLPLVGFKKDDNGRKICDGDNCYIGGLIFDHRRSFKVKGRGKARYAGVISAPYMYPEEIEPEARRISEQFGLSCRIGDPQDDYYGVVTTPVVFWNPNKVTL